MITLSMPYGQQLELFGISCSDNLVVTTVPAECGRSRDGQDKGRSDRIKRYRVATLRLKSQLNNCRQQGDVERLMYYYP